jgi:hypothetical protein
LSSSFFREEQGDFFLLQSQRTSEHNSYNSYNYVNSQLIWLESKYSALNNAGDLDHLVHAHVGTTLPMCISPVRPGMFF